MAAQVQRAQPRRTHAASGGADTPEPTARRKPLTMLPMTPWVWVLPTVLREGPPFFVRFLLLALFLWYRFDIGLILSGIDARVNDFCRR